MSLSCLKCGGTGILVDGTPCPDCSQELFNTVPIYTEVPSQYQGIKFDKSFLPMDMQKTYGEYMESLAKDIIENYMTFQKNMLICSRPNCGKTVWSYYLYSMLTSKGISIPPIRDIIEVRNVFNSFDNLELANSISSARIAIIRIPKDIQHWMFDTMLSVIERRVRMNGCTIFMYSGTYEDIKTFDRFDKMKYIKGAGSYNTVQVKSF